jgi:subtilisin family serine protease
MLLRLVVGALCLAAGLGGSAASQASGASRAGAIPGQYIVVLKDGSDSAAVAAKHGKKYGADVSFVYKHALKGYAAKLSASGKAAVQADPDVLFVSDDRELTADATSPPTFPQVTQRSITRIGGDKSSTRSGDGKGTVPINVAVIDSGIDTDHPDLNVVGGMNCVGDKGGFEDTYGHGTLVAGSIGALDNEIDFVGVAPGARLWAVRVLQKNTKTTEAQLICGIDWVTSTRSDGDATNDIAVANVSIGGQVKDADDGNCGRLKHDAEHLAICNSVAAGVTYVVSAGNSTEDIRDHPLAAYHEVLTATAISDTDGVPGGLGGPDTRCGDSAGDDIAAEFSNFATLPADQAHTVAAPGVCVPSTWFDGALGHESGTSFASPLVAGTVALCIYSGPCAGLTPARIIQKIVADAAAYNTASKNRGYGFQGDPLRPISGRYYGYLINASLY